MKKKLLAGAVFALFFSLASNVTLSQEALAYDWQDDYGRDFYMDSMRGFEQDDDEEVGKTSKISEEQRAYGQRLAIRESFQSDDDYEEYNSKTPRFKLGTAIENVTTVDNWPDQLSIFKSKGLEIERGPIESVKLGLLFNSSLNVKFPHEDSATTKWNGEQCIVFLSTEFKDHKTSFDFAYDFLAKTDGAYKFFSSIYELFLQHNFNEHNRVLLGLGPRLPIGMEGKVGTYQQDLPIRAYIGRTFGNTHAAGLRYQGDFKYADFDLSFNEARRSFTSYGGGLEFAGWVNFKPLANLDADKWGKITLGTGVDFGHSINNYKVWGAYFGYDYKRFHNKFEYAYADGYNGSHGHHGHGTNVTDGFYDTIIFDITPKFHLIGRIDCYNLDKEVRYSTNFIEYTAGFCYDISKNMKFLTSYTYRNHTNDNAHQVAVQMRLNI